MATLKHRVTDDGTHEVYVVDGGVNVQLLKVSGAEFESRRENAENRGDTAQADKANDKAKGGE